MPGVGLDIWNEQLSAPEGGAAPAPSRRTDAYTQPITSPPAPSRPPRVHFSQPGPQVLTDQGHQGPGSQGHQGPPGPQGHQGPPGPQGHQGFNGPAMGAFSHPAMGAFGPPAMGPSAFGPSAFGPSAMGPHGPAPVMLAEMKGDKGSSSENTWKRNDIWISLGLVFIVVLLIIVVFQLSRLNKILSKKFL